MPCGCTVLNAVRYAHPCVRSARNPTEYLSRRLTLVIYKWLF